MLTLIVLLCGFCHTAEPDLTLKIEKASVPAGVANAVKATLGEEACVLRTGGRIVMRIWRRAEIPVRASAEQFKNGLTYREIPSTTFVGVVELPQTFIDFRKQEIPAGTYTLRYALQPETGDHMGVTPHRDFLLLTPAEKDASLELLEVKALIEKSAEILKGDHPAVMMLFPEAGKAEEPSLLDKGDGVKVLRYRARMTADAGTTSLGIAVTVGGHVKE